MSIPSLFFFFSQCSKILYSFRYKVCTCLWECCSGTLEWIAPGFSWDYRFTLRSLVQSCVVIQNYLSITHLSRAYWHACAVLRTGWGFCSVLPLCITDKILECLVGPLSRGENPISVLFRITQKLTVHCF